MNPWWQAGCVSSGLLFGFSLLWLLSLWLEDVSIVDIAWGPAFIVVAAIGAVVGGLSHPRAPLVLGLVFVWGLRLATYLFVRNRGRPEDYRYGGMRKKHGRRFWWVSFFTVFLLQAALVLLISLPLQTIFWTGAPPPLGLVDALALLLVGTGLFFETVADLELARYRRDPANQGRVMDRGLWRYSRHPNYFGDALVWWGFGLFGLASGHPVGLVGPLLMTFLLLRVSGVALLEATIAERRPEYASYVARTSAFFPWRTRRSEG